MQRPKDALHDLKRWRVQVAPECGHVSVAPVVPASLSP
jgi:hypothetical protein